MKTIKYKHEDEAFQRALYQRVNDYFNENKLSKTGNFKLYIKGIILFSTFLVVYILLLLSDSVQALYVCNALLGMLTIFVALNIGHDAAHHTFCTNKKVNNLLLYTFDCLGASGYMWRLKHVHSHHPHVNIPDMDGDIKQSNLVRIFPNAPYFTFHKYQHVYMPFLYMCYTLNWLLLRDFKDFFETKISGKPIARHPIKEYATLIIGKVIFFSRMLLLPYLFTGFPFTTICLGFILFHFAASFTVTLALVSAHIGADSVYPEPDKNGQMPTSWVRHQLNTTCDFSTNNPIITHLFGGFNHHVIHHLFPNVCHIHYPAMTKILIQTCSDYGLSYKSNPSLLSAVLSHLKFLKIRSQKNLAHEWPDM